MKKLQRPERLERILISLEVLEVDAYSKLLLANMIYKKQAHPDEKLDDVIRDITSKSKYMPDQFKEKKGRTYLQRHWQAEIEALEEKLHECENLPTDGDLYNGEIVKNTVIYYVEKLNYIESATTEIRKWQISQEMQEAMITIVFLKYLYSDMSVTECIKKLQLHTSIKREEIFKSLVECKNLPVVSGDELIEATITYFLDKVS